ncbi:MBL fold metallo-hydrolase, partial [Salmonella enterica subsp. enterica serovar Havana]|nr:MBL fold metallo-hydrolase [Salmonella enterica subsp. enterica serovar Havana]HAD9412118.1 MBL fold metallo-hydrolase [Salmonella enterica]HAZ2978951.1 MBL fold metallo-hydrolase [Salmonella enterica subsp. enterica serovar Havana]
MKLTQIRNATLVLEYAGKRFLIDPMLAEKEAWPGFPGTARSHLRNPRVGLPVAVDELMNVDAVIVTHTHLDHWDEAAQQLIPKNKTIFSQHDADAALIRAQGFTDVRVLQDENHYAGITIMKTDGQHGSDEAFANPEMAVFLGDACGLVFSHASEKVLYIAGDTIWVNSYAGTLTTCKPDVVVINAGFAQVDGYGAIIMGTEDILRTHQLLPDAVVVASHLEAINHCVLTRNEINEFVQQNGIQRSVRVPDDGETLSF